VNTSGLHPVLRQWATYQGSERTRWIYTAPTDLLREALRSWEQAVAAGDEFAAGASAPAALAVVEQVRRVLALRSQADRSRICPACGYSGLGRPPYLAYEGPEMAMGSRPPYGAHLGDPSHDQCPCCGYQFGYHDVAGEGGPPVAFEDWRGTWLACGGPWVEADRRPSDWDPAAQLRHAGIGVQYNLTDVK
jgi:hypothetical protein